MRGQGYVIDNFSETALVSQTTTLPFTDHFTNMVNGSNLDRVWTEKAGAFTIQTNAAVPAVTQSFSFATLNTAPVTDTSVQADVASTYPRR